MGHDLHKSSPCSQFAGDELVFFDSSPPLLRCFWTSTRMSAGRRRRLWHSAWNTSTALPSPHTSTSRCVSVSRVGPGGIQKKRASCDLIVVRIKPAGTCLHPVSLLVQLKRFQEICHFELRRPALTVLLAFLCHLATFAQRELGQRYAGIGVLRSAQEIYERLEMWEDVINCMVAMV